MKLRISQKKIPLHLRKYFKPIGYKPKDLVNIPFLVSEALREDGWYLRQDIIWHKLNPMPESVTDRCTKAHEYLFLLSKNEKYYFNQIKESNQDNHPHYKDTIKEYSPLSCKRKENDGKPTECFKQYRRSEDGRNKRSVWTINTHPFPEAHFATFPPDLIEPCILAGSAKGDIIFDPFMGAGTTAIVAEKWNRQWIGIELNQEYCEIAKKRIIRETRQLTIC